MMKALVNFATDHYCDAQRRLEETARPWFDHLFMHRRLSDSFHAAHHGQLQYRRGFGFWCWKPHMIAETLRLAEQHGGSHSVVMWCDSQCMFVHDPEPLFELCAKNDGVMLFHQKREGHTNRKWTRRDCFIKMKCDTPTYHDGDQLNVAVMVYSPTQWAYDLLGEWQKWVEDLQVVGDTPSKLGKELPGFKDHRHDQSVMSLLAIKHDIKTYPDPTQYGNGYEIVSRGYPQVLQIDRMVSACYPIPCLSPG